MWRLHWKNATPRFRVRGFNEAFPARTSALSGISTSAVPIRLLASSLAGARTHIRSIQGPVRSKSSATSSENLSSTGHELLRSRFKVDDEFQVLEAYDKWAETYDSDSFGVLEFDSPKQCALYTLKYWPRENAEVGFSSGCTVLDVGCGTGALAKLLGDLSSQNEIVTKHTTYIGFDLTPKMLEVAKTQGRYSQLDVHSVTAFPWPYETNSMDLVMCNGVLIYVDDPNCLHEFVRVAKPGGHIILMIRADGLDVYRSTMTQLEQEGEWQLVEVSDTRNNFPQAKALQETGEEADNEDVLYNIHVFKKALPSS